MKRSCAVLRPGDLIGVDGEFKKTQTGELLSSLPSSRS